MKSVITYICMSTISGPLCLTALLPCNFMPVRVTVPGMAIYTTAPAVTALFSLHWDDLTWALTRDKAITPPYCKHKEGEREGR